MNKLIHTFEMQTRWSDMDARGHVNNGIFLFYLEEARIDLLLAEETKEGRSLYDNSVVARNEISYYRPLDDRSRRQVEISVWVSEIGRSSYRFKFVVGDRASAHVRGSTVMVRCDEHGSPVVLSMPERLFLQRYDCTE